MRWKIGSCPFGWALTLDGEVLAVSDDVNALPLSRASARAPSAVNAIGGPAPAPLVHVIRYISRAGR